MTMALKPKRTWTKGGSPPIWVQSHQEICESLEYFCSYKSGVCLQDNSAEGYFLGSFAARGGKLVTGLDPKHGHGHQDQTASDKSVCAHLQNHTDRQPLVLLEG
ncbi:hypothetical protein PISMIDRAFT_25344 [Pisolithus microcarpus 441]|uniref:Uncharacterized protein n=1 Tax=Pisolithus microcarpus 441 TaxID=765257 RepID=A0A0C9Z451_9AGAM|nr:hypothetical protein BKA83DRAFT_25344 [Pisolithus microcarpus]KIK14798.1 hypothetical protein PISMIDRAFT_25344 [Pisolithus microcarpus 441]